MYSFNDGDFYTKDILIAVIVRVSQMAIEYFVARFCCVSHIKLVKMIHQIKIKKREGNWDSAVPVIWNDFYKGISKVENPFPCQGCRLYCFHQTILAQLRHHRLTNYRHLHVR